MILWFFPSMRNQFSRGSMRKLLSLTLFCLLFSMRLSATCPPECTNPANIWFVDNSNMVAGDGSYTNPFNSLFLAQTNSGPREMI